MMMKEMTAENKKSLVQLAQGLLESYESVERIEHHEDGLVVYGKDSCYRFVVTFGFSLVLMTKASNGGGDVVESLILPTDEEFFNALREFFIEDALSLEKIEGYYLNRIEEEAGMQEEVDGDSVN